MVGERILVVDDEEVIRDAMERVLEGAGCQVATAPSGQVAVEMLQDQLFHVVLTDLKMPGMSGMEVLKAIRILQPEVPVVIITGYSTVETAVEAMKNGAFDYIAKPFTPDQITSIVQRALEQRAFALQNYSPDSGLPKDLEGFEDFVGDSEPMRKVYRRILQVAPTDSTVLITGESGTGKELVARAIVRKSPRNGKPFMAVDCTSLVENLLESELFGHVKGSFTGAIQTKTGLFKVADSGTLFLDEIANISLTTQAKLLRVLQERQITPIGDTHPVPVDIRLVTATNKDLRQMVAAGAFREDLLFRLNIIPIHVPPLRERMEDLPKLVKHFLKQFVEDTGKDIRGLAPAAMAVLEKYPFHGNVRELENIIERAVVLAHNPLIQVEDLEISTSEAGEDASASEAVPRTAEELKQTKKQIREMAVLPVERAFVLDALERNAWNITRAADEVGMARPNFQALLKKLGISARDRQVQEQ